jgi:hypothetical protein
VYVTDSTADALCVKPTIRLPAPMPLESPVAVAVNTALPAPTNSAWSSAFNGNGGTKVEVAVELIALSVSPDGPAKSIVPSNAAAWSTWWNTGVEDRSTALLSGRRTLRSAVKLIVIVAGDMSRFS